VRCESGYQYMTGFARQMPIDVMQTILGHASLQTTSIYVRAEQTGVLEAAVQYYAQEGEA
jgi:site-specific recombinase XerD